MKKAPNAKIGCKACESLLNTEWTSESGFTVKMPQTNKVTNIIGEHKKKKKSSKTVSLF